MKRISIFFESASARISNGLVRSNTYTILMLRWKHHDSLSSCVGMLEKEHSGFTRSTCRLLCYVKEGEAYRHAKMVWVSAGASLMMMMMSPILLHQQGINYCSANNIPLSGFMSWVSYSSRKRRFAETNLVLRFSDQSSVSSGNMKLPMSNPKMVRTDSFMSPLLLPIKCI